MRNVQEQNPSRNWRNLHSLKNFYSTPIYIYDLANKVLPSEYNMFLRKTILIQNVGQKVDKSDPFGTREPLNCIGLEENCIYSLPKT